MVKFNSVQVELHWLHCMNIDQDMTGWVLKVEAQDIFMLQVG